MSREFNFIKDLLRPERVLTGPPYTCVAGRSAMRKFRNVKVDFALGVKPHDAETERLPVLIVGNIRLLKLLQFEDLRVKLEPSVTSEVFDLAVRKLQPIPSDVCSLFVNQISIAALQDNVTHYNSSAQPHALTKLVKSVVTGPNWNIVVVCDKRDVFASGCAIARTFPVYSRKTLGHVEAANVDTTIRVEFLIFDDDKLMTPSDFATPELQSVTATLLDTAFAIQLTARLVDMPCCELNVNDFVDEVRVVGNLLNMKPFICCGEELARKGMNGLYSVGRGASAPAALCVLSHTVPNATHTIAWVGKGIVYDTGGLCIKGRTSMPGMKRDCGGAAAILGAFYVAVKRGFKQNLHVVFCLAENAVGPLSTKPDDIFRLYSGRTVEVNNTDAEGRLVLADGVAYAQLNLKADIILDMATLTGAQSVSTGKYHAAIMSNMQVWEKLVVQAGIESGDLAFPIPYCPELHFSEFVSAVADMKNSCADRTNALASCAGLFIASHLGFDTKTTWIHVDIAGVAYSGERATGYGVALLSVLFGYLSNDEHLKYLCPNKVNVISSCGEAGGNNSTSSSSQNCTPPSGPSPSKKPKRK